MFGRSGEEVTRGVRKYRDDKQKFCSASGVVRVMGIKEDKRAEERNSQIKKCTKFWPGNTRRRNNFGRYRNGWHDNIKTDLKILDGKCVLD